MKKYVADLPRRIFELVLAGCALMIAIPMVMMQPTVLSIMLLAVLLILTLFIVWAFLRHLEGRK